MDTDQFNLFLDLAKMRNFSRVAKKNFRTQPAVSISIQKLEAALGVKLFDRVGQKVKLSPQGEILEKQISLIHRSLQELQSQAMRLSRHPKGRIRIATIHSVGLYELGKAIRSFIKKYRNTRLDLHYEQCQAIYDLVEGKEIDFGVVAYPLESRGLEVIPVAEDEMVLITSPSSNLKGRAIPLKKLDKMDFVAFAEDTPTRSAIDDAFKKAGIRVSIRFENDNIETIKSAVEVGMGVGIVPLKTVEDERQAGRLRVLKIQTPGHDGHRFKRPIGIIKLRNSPLSPAADFFIRDLLKHCGSPAS